MLISIRLDGWSYQDVKNHFYSLQAQKSSFVCEQKASIGPPLYSIIVCCRHIQLETKQACGCLMVAFNHTIKKKKERTQVFSKSVNVICPSDNPIIVFVWVLSNRKKASVYWCGILESEDLSFELLDIARPMLGLEGLRSTSAAAAWNWDWDLLSCTTTEMQSLCSQWG